MAADSSRQAWVEMALEAANGCAWEWESGRGSVLWTADSWRRSGVEPEDSIPLLALRSGRLCPQDGDRVEKWWRECCAAGGESRVEYRLTLPGGGQRWLQARARPAGEEGAERYRYAGITCDVTDGEQLKAARRESEVNLRRFTEAAPVSIAMFDDKMRYLAASRRFCADYHIDADPLAGLSHYDVFPEIPEKWRAIHTRCLAGETESHPGELFVRADGQRQWVRWAIQPWRKEDGSVGGLVLFSEDITGQKLSEEALQQNESRLRLAHQAANVGTFDVDLVTGERYWSPQLLAIYGLPQDGGTPSRDRWYAMAPESDREYLRGCVEESLKAGRFDAEWRILRPDGQERWMTGRGAFVRDEEGKPLRFIGLHMDITERKQAEMEVLRLNSELELRVRERTAALARTNLELEAFGYSVSHDLRAPLRGIDGWSLALEEDYAGRLDQQGQGYIARVRSETKRMGRLIDDLLELSRIGRQRMQRRRVDLSAMARRVAERLLEGNGERRIEFRIEPGLHAQGDAGLLELAVANLLENAVKFTGKRERASIEFGRNRNIEGEAYTVSDNGAGFDMKYAATIFNPFQRLHSSREFSGTGIGLAIVQRVIHRHGGRIWAEAVPEHGAAFHFTLEIGNDR